MGKRRVSEILSENLALGGFGSPSDALLGTAKEFIDNAIDAYASSTIDPCLRKIKVWIEEITNLPGGCGIFKVKVADWGTGMSRDEVTELLGHLHSTSKEGISYGTFGIGVKIALIYAQQTAQSPLHVRTVDKKGHLTDVWMKIDLKTDRPALCNALYSDKANEPSGTTVSISLKGSTKNASVQRIVSYVEEIFVLNPMLQIELDFKIPSLRQQSRLAPSLDSSTNFVRVFSHISHPIEDIDSLKSALGNCWRFEGLATSKHVERMADPAQPSGPTTFTVSCAALLNCSLDYELQHSVVAPYQASYMHLHRFANGMPLLLEPDPCAITRAVLSQVKWSPYGISMATTAHIDTENRCRVKFKSESNIVRNMILVVDVSSPHILWANLQKTHVQQHPIYAKAISETMKVALGELKSRHLFMTEAEHKLMEMEEVYFPSVAGSLSRILSRSKSDIFAHGLPNMPQPEMSEGLQKMVIEERLRGIFQRLAQLAPNTDSSSTV
mmetsp:Transcript_8780/g.14420  ORF Transcript_8780/g.14420 Transcript_8780/m.14420 type:complete len:498 (-) Transcript_8780:779-2272(-)